MDTPFGRSTEAWAVCVSRKVEWRQFSDQVRDQLAQCWREARARKSLPIGAGVGKKVEQINKQFEDWNSLISVVQDPEKYMQKLLGKALLDGAWNAGHMTSGKREEVLRFIYNTYRGIYVPAQQAVARDIMGAAFDQLERIHIDTLSQLVYVTSELEAEFPNFSMYATNDVHDAIMEWAELRDAAFVEAVAQQKAEAERQAAAERKRREAERQAAATRERQRQEAKHAAQQARQQPQRQSQPAGKQFARCDEQAYLLDNPQLARQYKLPADCCRLIRGQADAYAQWLRQVDPGVFGQQVHDQVDQVRVGEQRERRKYSLYCGG